MNFICGGWRPRVYAPSLSMRRVASALARNYQRRDARFQTFISPSSSPFSAAAAFALRPESVSVSSPPRDTRLRRSSDDATGIAYRNARPMWRPGLASRPAVPRGYALFRIVARYSGASSGVSAARCWVMVNRVWRCGVAEWKDWAGGGEAVGNDWRASRTHAPR